MAATKSKSTATKAPEPKTADVSKSSPTASHDSENRGPALERKAEGEEVTDEPGKSEDADAAALGDVDVARPDLAREDDGEFDIKVIVIEDPETDIEEGDEILSVDPVLKVGRRVKREASKK